MGVGQKSNLKKRFRRPTPARMTSIEKACFEAQFQYSQLLPI